MRQKILKLVSDGLYKEAIFLHSKHHSASQPPHRFTFPPLLKACANLNSPLQGQILQTQIIKTGFLSDTYTETALCDMYMKLTLFHEARKVFDKMSDRNLASYNAMISGFSRNGFVREAFVVFRELGFEGFMPNSVSLASVLPACEESCVLCLFVHCWAIKLGVEMDVYVATSLVTVYSTCGEIVLATRLFGQIENKNVVTYNAFVSGLLQNGVHSVVLDVFKDMRQFPRQKPNSVTLICVISACASLLYLKFGRQVHGFLMKTEMDYETKVGTALLDMYSKCGWWQCAYAVFNELNGSRNLITWNSMIAGMMSNGQSENAVMLFELLESNGLDPDSATWNSMISGFTQLGKGTEAITFFKKMQAAGVIPSLKSVTSLLPACASMSALQRGKEIHGNSIRIATDTDEFMATALIDMYMKCGNSSWARRIFDQFTIKPKDPAFWNAIMCGYGRNGENETTLKIFENMLEEKVEPNSATFTAVLSACSHSGHVEKGWQVFRMMTEDYRLKPNPEHFGCMVDLLGRSGRLDQARKLIEDMPEPPPSVFASLLGACREQLCPELGEEMATKLSELEPGDPSPFIILSNIYAGLGRWGDAERSRQMIDDRGQRKLPGISIEVTYEKKQVHDNCRTTLSHSLFTS